MYAARSLPYFFFLIILSILKITFLGLFMLLAKIRGNHRIID